ncbi:MAG TPA: radical SAM family heme chaperone HemW [Salinisphaeraceae bacterium]|nr:radical SAM family heme chaperone HemW [Salinisphaeraceae bacterium]
MPEAAANANTAARIKRADIPLALYVHLPWCVRKCPYCDFNSHRLLGDMPEQDYVDALLADLAIAIPANESRPLASIFFGGGTPSLFSPRAIGRILEAVAARIALADDCEITLEANPGAAEHGQFRGYRSAGVTRISLGVQSLDDAALRQLGRVHDARAALAAIDAVQVAGFERMNCDLMFGLPGQTPATAAADVASILARAPGHISYYQLTLEPGTPFYHRPPPRPDDDTIVDIFEASAATLAANGYQQYEVSAWARPGAACRHNRNYWTFGDYLAIGAGAHGKLTGADGSIRRSTRQRWPRAYMQLAGSSAVITETRELTPDERRFEFLLNGLRLKNGITRRQYETRTGLSWAALQQHLAPASDDGLVLIDADNLRASERGWYYLDSILTQVLPDA